MKQVRELSDISASIVLNRKGEHVATVQIRRTSGSAQCDVWARKPGESFLSLVHQKKAHGYGYDRAAAALAGAVIEGFQLADHCGHVEPAGEKKRAALMRAYLKNPTAPDQEWREKAKRIGCSFANWREGRYISLHNITGLDRLIALGYRVIEAL